MELEPENKKQKTGEEEDLDSLLLKWAKGSGLNDGWASKWMEVLGATGVGNVEALKQLASNTDGWDGMIKDFNNVPATRMLATNLEIWKKALGGDFLFSLPLFFFRRHVD